MLSLRPSAFAGVRLARLAPPSSGAKGSPIEGRSGDAADDIRRRRNQAL
jgi:hypothetical protein